MPRARAPVASPLNQRIGRALLRGRDDEGLVAAEDGRIVACSPHAAELLGCDPRMVEGAPVDAFLGEVRDEVLRLRLQSALRDEAAVEFIAPRPGREDEWLEVRALPLAPGVAFLLRDVTDRELSDRTIRRKEQRLLAANLSLRLAHAAAHAASWEWRRGHLLRWLDLGAARELDCLPLAWTEDEQIRDWRSIVRLAGARPYHRAVASLGRTGFAALEIEVVGADEAAHWLRIECAVTEHDGLGRASRVSGVIVDVTQRKRAEAHQQLLVQELNHRVKNMLATVQSIARQSLAGPELGEVAHEFESRLMALAWAYEILTREHWAGASLREVVQRTLAPHEGHGSGRVSLSGPDLWLTPGRALSLALALHELVTNAVKYGALSNDLGRIDVTWDVTGEDGARRLDLEWAEHGGPPVAAPRRKGFGARLLERSLARELQGEVSLDFDPEGVRCHMRAPLRRGE